jgi:cytochrome c-type biogenesis protein CcmH
MSPAMRAAASVVAMCATTLSAGLAAQEPQEPDSSGVGAVVQIQQETQLERDVRAVSSQLRCVVCQGLSLQDSPSELAQEMRGIVREQLAAGRSQQEVKDYFVSKYGEWVLMEPKRQGFNLAVYVLPVVMLVGGAGFVVYKARQWSAA